MLCDELYELESRFDDDGIKVTMMTRDRRRYLSYLFKQAEGRLMAGIRPDADKAISFMKEKYPKKLKAVIDALDKNFTESGLLEFERAMTKGFKKLGVWNR
jgi:hypothetical protein